MFGTVVRTLGGRVRRRLPGRAAVLGYHRVATVRRDPWHLAVSPEHFDEQLAVLGRVGQVGALGEVLDESAWRRVGRTGPRFAITFDDGYVDNLLAAVPVLERHAAPATVFIAPGLLDQPSYWWDVLAEWALDRGCTCDQLVAAAVVCDVFDDAQATSLDGADVDTVHAALYAEIVSLPLAAISPLLERLAVASGVPVPMPAARPLTTPELRELAAHPLVTIGVHTVTHPQLTLLGADEVRGEISAAATALSDLLGPAERVLAYPYGATSPSVARLAASTGIHHAVTTDARWIGLFGEDPLLTPRLHPRDSDGAAFEEWIRRWA
jgi:peptidoglycan/xylan/chitin deacetylase (PgdA/CDA1 family)